MNSGYHQKNASAFNTNPDKFINEFSKDFEEMFMTVLREKYGNRTVLANKVYQDYINFRDHIHMNATKWDSLSSFCKVYFV